MEYTNEIITPVAEFKTDEEILRDCNDFLKRSSNRYSSSIEKALRDLRRFSGNFWDAELTSEWKRSKRKNLAMNNWNTMANAISSPVSNSPWHIELTDKSPETGNGEIQEGIDTFESDSESKMAMIDAFRKSCLCGYGYGVMTTVEDELDGTPKLLLESARHIDAIALDPSVNSIDGSDAEEGAVINYLPLKRAKRLYGDDVVPFAYPDAQCTITFSYSPCQWKVPQGSVAEITYYVKNEAGTVDYYKIVGDKIVQRAVLPIKIIPIIRFAGNEIYNSDGQIDYDGIIRQTFSLELGANVAFSTLMERVGRSAKPNVMAHVDAVDGLERQLAAINQDDSVAYLWKGEHQPVLLTESFQTGDLQNTISTCRTLMEDTLGIPLTGIIDQRERTATEILRQECSKESNTANYYNHAYSAMRTIGRIVIQMLNGGSDLKFTLENGPSIITRQMKNRQELTALASIMPDNMKPVLAKYFADTLKNDIGEDLSRNIVANLPPDVKFIPERMDPAAVHEMDQMKMQMEETMAELQKKDQEVQELKKQLTMAQINMLNSREQRNQDWQKFLIAEQNRMNLEAAKLGVQEDKNMNDAILKQQEVNIKAAESEMASQERETDAFVQGAEEMLDRVTGGI